MKLFEKLQWFWDPRSDNEKAYAKWDSETPLQRRTQKLNVHIKSSSTPIAISYSREDWASGLGNLRWASNKDTFDSFLKEWLANRGSKGITIDSVWYSPESIERIELGEQIVEAI